MGVVTIVLDTNVVEWSGMNCLRRAFNLTICVFCGACDCCVECWHCVNLVIHPQNRAFDHMLGFLPGVDGLHGSESNLVNTSDPSSERVTVNNTSPYIGPFDPDHSVQATTDKIFGQACLATDCNAPTMSGFIEFESARHGVEASKSVMNAFTPARLPVMSTLAEEFAVFDRFFCSVPGPTFPNRLFQLMGSSKGDTRTKV